MIIKKLTFLFYLVFILGCSEDETIEFNQWTLSDDSFNELLLLSDTANLSDYEIFGNRIDRIQTIFAEKQDPRGTFTTLYEQITYEALKSIDEAIYEDGEFVGDFGLAFGKRYLINLHYHLLNQPVDYTWEVYYNYSQSSNHFTYLLLTGMNAHITKDLTDALIELKVTPEKEADWVLISTPLVQGLGTFQTEFESAYSTNLTNLLGLYGFGEFLDEIFGEDATIYTILNELRYLGYLDALKYQTGFEKNIDYKVKKRFEDQQNIIILADELGLLP